MRPLSKLEQGIAMLLMLILLAAAISTAASAQVFVFSNPAPAPTRFADAEVPAGTSTALVFQLAQPPAPAESLQVFLNGMLMTRGKDYALSGGTVTFISHYSTMLAAGGNTIVAFYRY